MSPAEKVSVFCLHSGSLKFRKLKFMVIENSKDNNTIQKVDVYIEWLK